MLSSVDIDDDFQVTKYFPTSDPDVQFTDVAVKVDVPYVVDPSEPDASNTEDPDSNPNDMLK